MTLARLKMESLGMNCEEVLILDGFPTLRTDIIYIRAGRPALSMANIFAWAVLVG
jgi:hypothetical protein